MDKGYKFKMDHNTDLPWILIASANNLSYSSLEQIYLDYQFACFKFGLTPHLHVRVSRVAVDEFRLCTSMQLSQRVDADVNALTRPPSYLWHDLPLSSVPVR